MRQPVHSGRYIGGLERLRDGTMNDKHRDRVYGQLSYRYRHLLSGQCVREVIDEVYSWAWIFSNGAMTDKAIDKACRTHAMSLGWRRHMGIGKWHRKELSGTGTVLGLAAGSFQNRVFLRSPGECAPRIRNKAFKRTPIAQR
jgi:hypothetical protein